MAVRRKWLLSVVLVLFVAGAAAAFLAYRLVTRTSLGLTLADNSAPSGTLVGNLSSRDGEVVRASLYQLKARQDPAGREPAAGLLGSRDDYIWFNAALYLGAIGDQRAVPYLIKGLRHPAHRSYPEVAATLQRLTGEAHGTDQAEWRAWWDQASPGANFSFAYPGLARQAYEIRTGSVVLVTHVPDPLHAGAVGTQVALVGLRLKPGASPAAARRALATAVLGQYVEVRRDTTAADKASADDVASVPAILTRVPDPGVNATLASALRRGLPPVPFSGRASVHAHLLQTGLYELAPDTVADPVLRAALGATVPATGPAPATATAPSTAPGSGS